MRVCKLKECEKKLWAYGYCSQHGQRFLKYGSPEVLISEQHGMRHSPEYRSWVHMKDRCLRPTDKSYLRYGSRGIKICDKWLNSFTAFYNDMGNKPSAGHSLDRIDNDGNYEPGNCRWSTSKEQANNRRSNRPVTYNGETRSAKEWANSTGIDYNTLRQRLFRYNWPIEKALKKGLACL